MNAADIIDRALDSGVYLYLDDEKLKFRAPEGGLDSELMAQIKAHKPEIVELLAQLEVEQADSGFVLPPITKRQDDGAAEVSFAQQRLWFVDQMGGNTAQYNMPGAFRLNGTLDVAAFERAVAAIIERHEVLRTRFDSHDGQPQQIVQQDYQVPLKQRDLSHLDEQQQQQEVEALAKQQARTPFDLSRDILFRVELLRLSSTRAVVLFNLHHIASDGWSKAILIREFCALYEAFSQNKSNPLAPLTVQYADFSAWQRSWLQGEVLQQQLGYWEQQLAGIPQVHNLPLDHPRPSQQSHRGASYRQQINPGLFEGIKALCLRQDATLFMLLQSAFAILVNRYSGEGDVVVGSAIAGRVHKDVEPLIGFFINTLVVRNDLSDNLPFNEFLARTKQTILEGYNHQHIPFEMLVERLSPERTLRYNPIVQLKLDVQNTEQAKLQLPGLALELLDEARDVARHDIYLSATENENGLTIDWQYSLDLFNRETIARMAENFTLLLQSIINTPSKAIHELSMVTAAEREILLERFNQSDVEYPTGLCVHQLFEQQATLHPDNIAVIHAGEKISYRELNARANRLAHYLCGLGVQPDSLVGLCVERSIEMYIGLFAIMKAGAGYVPLDPNYPPSRLEYMLEDSAVDIILTESHLFGNLDIAEQTIVLLDEQMLDAVTGECSDADIDPATIGLTPGNLAYVIYTSGSTGKPKGVLVEHHTVVNFLYYSAETFMPTHTEGALVSAPLAFDGTVCTLYSPFLQGKYVELLAAGDTAFDVLAEYLFDHSRALLFKLTPAHLEALASLNPGRRNPDAKHVFVIAGELLTEKNLSVWRDERLPNCLFFNEYGPTECTVGTTVYRTHSGKAIETVTAGVPIGSPLANAKLYVLDRHRALLPMGAPAQLYIGGLQVARGYHNQRQMTADKFLDDPFSPQSGARMYRTGDLVRWLPCGNIEFLGRVDHQVKLRGYRIELGEIENQMSQLPGIGEVVVICRDDEGFERRLVAYVVPSEPLEAEDEELLVEQKRARVNQYIDGLKGKLPQYMIPGIVVFMERFELTPNGKIDRLGLPQPGEGDMQKQVYIAPRNEVEAKLCEIWQEVLGVTQIGIEDNFFSLGGDSIVSIQVVSRAKTVGLHLTVRDMFEYQSIAAISPFVGKGVEIDAPQQPTMGEQLLLPIQQAFFHRRLAVPNHFNQAVLLSTPNTFEFAHLIEIVAAVYQRHDALRLRFDDNGKASYQPFDEAMVQQTLACHDLSDVNGAAKEQQLETLCNRYQASLDLQAGPLFKAVWFDFGQGQGRLLLVIHHLVVDGVSWRILAQDLSRAWQQLSAGQEVVVAAKGSSLQQWGQALSDYADSQELSRERGYWLKQINKPLGVLPIAKVASDAQQARFSLEVQQTQALLGECNDALRTQVNELLLAALLLAYRHWNGQCCLQVDMEGHGREALFEQLDINDTLGWFTSHYPLILQTEEAADIDGIIKAVKEQHRELPHHGIGYGILTLLAKDEQLLKHQSRQGQQGIAFNYLGQFDNSFEQAAFALAPEDCGLPSSPLNRPQALLKIDAQVIKGQLSVTLNAAAGHFAEGAAQALAQAYREALLGCIEHCLMLNTLKLEQSSGQTQNNNQENDDVEAIFL